MPLVFAAITPHPPFLLPTIGKDSLAKIEKTKLALEKLEEDLYLSKPDIIMIFSPHGTILSDAFTINICSEFTTDFKEFGDVTTKQKFKGELSIASGSREEGQENKIPFALISEPNLDYGAAIPLMYLTRHLPEVSILPVGFSALDGKTHADFGYFLKEQIMRSSKRVAVIASADLSHALTVVAPAGYHAEGPEFDQKIQELLSTKNTIGLLQLSPTFVTNAHECGLRAILMLMGVLRGIQYDFKTYCYEAPFGVGYLTANFGL